MSARLGKTAQRKAIREFAHFWLNELRLIEKAERRLLAASDRPWLPGLLTRWCNTQEEKWSQQLTDLAKLYGWHSDAGLYFDSARMSRDHAWFLFLATIQHWRWSCSVKAMADRLPLADCYERGQVAVECFMEGIWDIPAKLTEAVEGRGEFAFVAEHFAAIQVASYSQARAEMLLSPLRLGRKPNSGILDTILERDPRAIHRAFQDYDSAHGRWPSQDEHAEHLAAMLSLDGLSTDTVTRARSARGIPWPPL